MNLKNTYIIGDVHGCYYTLLNLVKQLPKDANLIFLGDLCDKGNFSKETIEFVINNDHICLKGNHEYLFYNYIRDALYRDKKSIWSQNRAYGGYKTVKNYNGSPDVLSKHIAWIETLPAYVELDRYFITHGFGLPYYQRKDDKKTQRKLFVNRVDVDIHKEDWEDFTNYDVINIFGHCKFDEVLIGENYYGIDTGCVYGNKLTAIQLETMILFEEKVDKRDIS
jgi:serine/threonine protein phosphatase 1